MPLPRTTKVDKVEPLIVLPSDTTTLVLLLIKTDADWTEVLRFLGKVAERQGIFLDTQAIAEEVRKRLLADEH